MKVTTKPQLVFFITTLPGLAYLKQSAQNQPDEDCFPPLSFLTATNYMEGGRWKSRGGTETGLLNGNYIFSCSVNNSPRQINFKHMETSLVIIDAMGPQEWMTAGKVVIGGEEKAGGRKRGEGDRKRRFLLSNGRLLL